MQLNAKIVISRAVLAVFVCVIIGYAVFQTRGIIAGPQIIVDTPENGSTATSSLLTLSGRIERSKSAFIDDRPIFVDLEGRFFERLLLQKGYNIIDIKATDAQGRTREKTLEVIYAPISD